MTRFRGLARLPLFTLRLVHCPTCELSDLPLVKPQTLPWRRLQFLLRQLRHHIIQLIEYNCPLFLYRQIYQIKLLISSQGQQVTNIALACGMTYFKGYGLGPLFAWELMHHSKREGVQTHHHETSKGCLRPDFKVSNNFGIIYFTLQFSFLLLI